MNRVAAFLSRLRLRAFGGASALCLFHSFVALAGHDYVASFAIHESREGALADSAAPISFGSPVPQWVELQDLSHLTLVGAVASQLSVADRWPSGDVRWIHVDAVIKMPNGAPKTAVHLTAGALGPPAPDILTAKPDGSIEFAVGGTGLMIRPDGRLGVIVHSAAEATEPTGLLRLTESEDIVSSALKIHRNGPVAGVVELRREWAKGAVESMWIHVFVGASAIQLEHCWFVPPAEAEPSEGGGVVVDLGDGSDWLSVNSSSEEGQSIITRRRPPESLRLVFDSSTWEEVRSDGRLSLAPRFDDIPVGGWGRRRLALSVSENTAVELPVRLVSEKALTLNTYNDAQVFIDAVYPADDDPGASALGGFGAFRSEIYRALATPEMAASTTWLDLRVTLDQILADGELGRALPGETLTLWSRLTGDSAVAGLYQEWSEWFLAAFADIESSPFGATNTAGQCLDLVAAVDSKVARERLENWLRKLDERLGTDEAASREFARAHGAELLTVLGQTSRLFANIEPIESQSLDLLETFVRWGRETEPNDRVWIEGYYSTGDPDYLRGAGASVEASPNVSSTLRYLVEHPTRFSVWKDLDIEKTRKREAGFDLSWTPPARSHRVRLKAFVDEARPETETLFSEGKDVSVSEPLGPQGLPQTVFVEWTEDARPRFMARYLERGSALPALKREISVATTASSISKAINTMIVVAISAIGVLILVILWKRSVSV